MVDNALFDSAAANAGLEFDQEITAVFSPNKQLPKEIMYLPALLMLGLIVLLQRGRKRKQTSGQAEAQTA